MSKDDFSPEEREKLRELLTHSAEITEWLELRGAKKLVFQAYRQAIIGLAGLIGAVILLWDYLKELIKGLLV